MEGHELRLKEPQQSFRAMTEPKAPLYVIAVKMPDWTMWNHTLSALGAVPCAGRGKRPCLPVLKSGATESSPL